MFRAATELPALDPPMDRVTRYIDPYTGMVTAKLVPGQLFVGGLRDCITTVVGSCVTVCLHDPLARCGGMLQFLLPCPRGAAWPAGSGSDAAWRSAFLALETLVAMLEGRGSRRGQLRAKIFGAAKVDPALADSSRETIRLVREYFRSERILEDGADTGMLHARKIVFQPGDGRVRLKKLGDLPNDTLPRREREYYARVMARAGSTG